jgi:hypothetical protein
MNFKRNNILCDQIIFVDGMSGTGKSILSPILASFERVEKFKIDYNIEYTSVLAEYGKIDNASASLLIRLMADVGLFNSMISREVNLRPSDDSGILNNPDSWKYIKRLFKPGNKQVVTEIKEERPIFHIMSHNLLQTSKPVFEAFGEGLSMVVMVRHPVYMAEHWYNYIERFGEDAREFSLATGESGNIPWFSTDIENYLALSTMDKFVYGVQVLINMYKNTLFALERDKREQVNLIPFESFVLDPEPWIVILAEMLGTQTTSETRKILKKQRCPRQYINAGKGHKHYGFDRRTAHLSEKEDYDRRLTFIKEKASPEAFRILEGLSNDYEREHVFPRKMPWEI